MTKTMYRTQPKNDTIDNPKIKVGEYIRIDATTASQVIGYGPINDGTGRCGYLLANGVVLAFQRA